ncbi:MAG: PEP-CTERM sorting domain-containing protein [Anaerolineae bacterium]|nr:PEP-CTERM sorting domain-containing protein [Phycisphaerae bacterium]
MPQRQVRSLFLATTVLACAGSSVARAQFTISNPGTNPNTFVGQNFSPSVSPAPNPGLAAGANVFLQNFNFTSTGGVGNPNTRLVILPGAYYDTNGDPNGSFTPTIADVTGISTNTIDTDAALSGAPLNFTFSNLQMIYGNSYAAVFATVGAGNTLSFIPVGAMYANYVETSPGSGVFVPVTNYGGANNFNACALYPDFNGDGFFEADSPNTADAAFAATFAVPEPASLAALGCLGMTGLIRRRTR